RITLLCQHRDECFPSSDKRAGHVVAVFDQLTVGVFPVRVDDRDPVGETLGPATPLVDSEQGVLRGLTVGTVRCEDQRTIVFRQVTLPGYSAAVPVTLGQSFNEQAERTVEMSDVVAVEQLLDIEPLRGETVRRLHSLQVDPCLGGLCLPTTFGEHFVVPQQRRALEVAGFVPESAGEHDRRDRLVGVEPSLPGKITLYLDT